MTEVATYSYEEFLSDLATALVKDDGLWSTHPQAATIEGGGEDHVIEAP